MVEGDEDLGLVLAQLGDDGADDALAAGVALGAEAVEDAACCVALLGRGVQVVAEDLLDEGEEGIEDGLGAWLGAALCGGQVGLMDDLVDGAEVEVVLGGSLAEAQLAREDTTADISP